VLGILFLMLAVYDLFNVWRRKRPQHLPKWFDGFVAPQPMLTVLKNHIYFQSKN